MPKKVTIIGAGLAGLSAGIYLQREGFETQIFEQAPRAGGVCASWQRNGYRFDGCIQWMVGTRKGEPLYAIYKEVGALSDDTSVYYAGAMSLEIKGVIYNVPLKLEKFKKLLYTISARDAQEIDAFCADIDIVRQTMLFPGLPQGLKGIFNMLRQRDFLRIARKYKDTTVREVVKKFKSDIIGDILIRLMPGEYSALALFLMLGTRMGENAGYPLGGASEVVRRMEEKYRSLGGKLSCNARVDEILVTGGKAGGIRTNGDVYPSDGVVAACNADYTLKKLLRGRCRHPQLEDMLTRSPLFHPLAIVSFGLEKKLGIPFSASFEASEGFQVAPGIKTHGYHLRSFDFDPAAAPKNGSSVMVMLDVPLEYWLRLKLENPVDYKLQKEHLAEGIASELDARYPGFKDAVAVVDVATPATFIRLANVCKGSAMGFAPTPEALRIKVKKTIPGLKGFCICGQWTTAGGICTSIADGKAAAKIIKREIRR